MLLAGIIPWSGLPQWMYHGQEPPAPAPQGLPRLTWVDLVFPVFLFALGAAIPLAWASARGRPLPAVARAVLLRGGALFALAFVNQHLRPYAMAGTPTAREWLLGLLGFGLTLAAFVRLPEGWGLAARTGLRVAAWAGIALLVARLGYAHGRPGWDPERSDPILRVLAFASVAGAALWLATRDRPSYRLLAMVAVAGLCLAAKAGEGSWQRRLWVWDVPYLFDLPFLGYLLVVVPGTFAGESLARLAREAEPKRPRDGLLAAVLVATVGLALALLFARGPSTLWVAVPLALAWRLAADQGPELRAMVRGGIGLVALGLLIEPLDGGIRKDPWTLAYVVLTPGLALFGLAALLLAERSLPRLRTMRLLALTGANPLLAYTAVTNLWAPLWALTVGGFVAGITPGPAWGLLRAVGETALFALLVAWLTRKRVTMRA